ncbi:TIR domain-containing protein [Guptibacillus spartinae]|uniref:TIR domain-containing protein n=1 Tax=Guptibacillus spartinae TaxID=3025679 RepID=UPI002361751B|nr:TIR domain-containing protein [Pseudalkalibacillus spartinae]
MTMKVFISYDYDEDRTYKNMLKAWSKNSAEHFNNINFEDGSTDISINSTDRSAIRRAISRRMNTCDKIIVLVGEETYKSDWCKWEIEKAEDLGLSFAAVKINNSNQSPSELIGKGAKWARSFTKTAIENALTD